VVHRSGEDARVDEVLDHGGVLDHRLGIPGTLGPFDPSGIYDMMV
jgi:hypothetical protein